MHGGGYWTVSFAHELKAALHDAGGDAEIHLFPGEESVS